MYLSWTGFLLTSALIDTLLLFERTFLHRTRTSRTTANRESRTLTYWPFYLCFNLCPCRLPPFNHFDTRNCLINNNCGLLLLGTQSLVNAPSVEALSSASFLIRCYKPIYPNSRNDASGKTSLISEISNNAPRLSLAGDYATQILRTTKHEMGFPFCELWTPWVWLNSNPCDSYFPPYFCMHIRPFYLPHVSRTLRGLHTKSLSLIALWKYLVEDECRCSVGQSRGLFWLVGCVMIG